MPQCFQLFNKVNSQEAVSLNRIDEEVCNLLGSQVHDRYYGGTGENSFNWFDTIGFQIACGKPLGSEELKEYYTSSSLWKKELPVILRILEYLESNYTSNAFYSVR